MKNITMSRKEVDHYEVIQRLVRREINGTHAGWILKLSTRQVRRIKAKVMEKGAVGLVHENIYPEIQ